MGKKSHPSAFQGNLSKKFYFEGWYNKIINESSKHIHAIIPTIALNKKEGTSHAFIQYLDGVKATAEYFNFPLEEFETLSKTEYDIRLGKNHFSMNGFHIELDQQEHKIIGDLEYINPITWPKKFLQPGVMGWFSYMPFMQCNHGIVSMNHEIRGTLNIDGQTVNFDKGKGYMEKDWGTSFPSAYIWTQSNHFKEEKLSFMFSLAKVPFAGMKFNGFLSALWHDDDFYKFATYTRAKVRSLEITPVNLQVVIEDKKYLLEFDVAKEGLGFGLFKAPEEGVMSGHVAESINSKIKLKLKEKKSGNVIIDDFGVNAGLEIRDAELLKPKK